MDNIMGSRSEGNTSDFDPLGLDAGAHFETSFSSLEFYQISDKTDSLASELILGPKLDTEKDTELIDKLKEDKRLAVYDSDSGALLYDKSSGPEKKTIRFIDSQGQIVEKKITAIYAVDSKFIAKIHQQYVRCILEANKPQTDKVQKPLHKHRTWSHHKTAEGPSKRTNKSIRDKKQLQAQARSGTISTNKTSEMREKARFERNRKYQQTVQRIVTLMAKDSKTNLFNRLKESLQLGTGVRIIPDSRGEIEPKGGVQELGAVQGKNRLAQKVKDKASTYVTNGSPSLIVRVINVRKNLSSENSTDAPFKTDMNSTLGSQKSDANLSPRKWMKLSKKGR